MCERTRAINNRFLKQPASKIDFSKNDFFIILFACMKKKPSFAIHSHKKILGSVVQLVRMLPCHGRGRGFESRPVRLNPPVKWGVFD